MNNASCTLSTRCGRLDSWFCPRAMQPIDKLSYGTAADRRCSVFLMWMHASSVAIAWITHEEFFVGPTMHDGKRWVMLNLHATLCMPARAQDTFTLTLSRSRPSGGHPKVLSWSTGTSCLLASCIFVGGAKFWTLLYEEATSPHVKPCVDITGSGSN